jgi:hypothetical protein
VIGVVLSSGSLIAKTGLAAPWVTLSGGTAEVAINADPVRGITFMNRSTTGSAAVKFGIGGVWTTITGGATAIALP